QTLYALALVQFERGEADLGQHTLQQARELVVSIIADVPESMRANFTSHRACLALFSALEASAAGQLPRRLCLDGRSIELSEPALVGGALRPRAEEAIDAAAAEIRAHYEHIIGGDPKLLQIFQRVERVAASDSTVLILGES